MDNYPKPKLPPRKYKSRLGSVARAEYKVPKQSERHATRLSTAAERQEEKARLVATLRRVSIISTLCGALVGAMVVLAFQDCGVI